MGTQPGSPPARSLRRRRCVALLAAVTLGAALVLPLPAGERRDSLSREVETDRDRAATAAVQEGGEALLMRWKLTGFLGMLAGLFVPNEGDALLTYVPEAEDRTVIQVLVTAPKREGEFFLYGAAIDENAGSTAAVWSSYAFRDDRVEREQEVDEAGIIDYASAIYHLRWNPPRTLSRMTIWYHGKTYPVEVEPLRPEKRKISGKPLNVRGYSIHGVDEDGKSRFDDKFFVYFAMDEHATPVEISGKRGLLRVRIQLVRIDGRPASRPAIDRARSSPP